MKRVLIPATKVNGTWTSYTYEEYYDLVRQAARAFIQVD
jgi:hypothetical protein